eukprot:31023-Eustigmatos_ZCMA.PRE.1
MLCNNGKKEKLGVPWYHPDVSRFFRVLFEQLHLPSSPQALKIVEGKLSLIKDAAWKYVNEAGAHIRKRGFTEGQTAEEALDGTRRSQEDQE